MNYIISVNLAFDDLSCDFKITPSINIADYSEEILAAAVKGQEKAKKELWAKGLPWYYMDEKDNAIIDYENKKIIE